MSARDNLIKNFSRIHGFWIYKTFLKHSQYWSHERRDAHLVQEIRRTLLRAWEGSPYYRRVFENIGFDPRGDFGTLADVSQLPVLTKSDVREHRDEMIDHRFEANSIDFHTSGTTGEPLQMRLNESFLAFDSACIFRHWSWAGYTFRAPAAALRTYVPAHESDPLWRRDRINNTLYLSAYHLRPANCEQYLEQLLHFRPCFVRGYPSSIAVLAEYAYAHRNKLEFVRGIFTASETLLPSERDRIEGTFGKKIFNWYGMTEPAVIIAECEQHDGMHVNWEYGYAEFLPSEDLAPNEFRLVTTGFHNPVMPFIRYDTGDVVRLFDKPRKCTCHRTMPLIESISGRKDECIIMPDGRRLPSVNFYSVFRKYREVVKFQIVQFGRAELVAKIALRHDARNGDGLVRRLEQELRARIGFAAAFEVEITDRFLTNSDGKTPPILRKLGSRSVEEREEYKIASQEAWTLKRAGESVCKLDWNEADCVPSPEVRDRLCAVLADPDSICWYPDASSEELVALIASYAGVPDSAIVLTHGSDQGIELIASCFVHPGDKVLIVSPTYDNFRAVTEQHGASPQAFCYYGDAPFDLPSFEDRILRFGPRLVYLVNPNNPIGYVLSRETIGEILTFCSRFSSILVIDEAYFEFCGVTVADMTQKSSNIVVTRTFSKAFGMAGLRLGYLVGGSAITRVLRRVQNPKSVTMFAKAAALAALEHPNHISSYVDSVKRNREEFYRFFEQRGIHYRQSHGNFVLFQYERARDLISYLRSRSVFVRDRSHCFAGEGHLRITVGGDESTRKAIAALEEYFSQEPAKQLSARN